MSDVIPLYNDKDVLLQTIRMDKADDIETTAAIDQAISDVRLEIFKSIGSDRALLIEGYTSNANPTTEEEILRRTAEVLENYMVQYALIPILPLSFLAGKSETSYRFNDEALTRESSAISEFKDVLLAKIQKLKGELQSPETLTGSTKAALIGAEEPYLIDNNFVGQPRVGYGTN